MFGTAVHENDVVCLNDDGQLDDSFGDHGWVRLQQTISVDAIAVDELGRIYLGSRVGTTPNTTQVRRLTEDGALDASFGTAGDGSVHDLDGSLLTGNRTWKAIGGSRSNSACPGSAGWPRSHRSALPPPPLSTRHLETSRDG